MLRKGKRWWLGVRERRKRLTRSSTKVPLGVLLILGGMSRGMGLYCSERAGMFLMKVKLGGGRGEVNVAVHKIRKATL